MSDQPKKQSGVAPHGPRTDDSVNPDAATSLNFVPKPPMNQENGTKFGDVGASNEPRQEPQSSSQAVDTEEPTATTAKPGKTSRASAEARNSCHEARNSCHEPGEAAGGPRGPADLDPLEELLHHAAALAGARRGRPPALDENLKGQLVALLSVGLSIRQAAGLLGVSHTTVQRTLKSEPQLGEDVNAARFRAQLAPLACVIREARRSWKAATWLLKYFDNKLATHEETPAEKRERQDRESDEFFARCDEQRAKRA
jgi:hypothetical protein